MDILCHTLAIILNYLHPDFYLRHITDKVTDIQGVGDTYLPQNL